MIRIRNFDPVKASSKVLVYLARTAAARETAGRGAARARGAAAREAAAKYVCVRLARPQHSNDLRQENFGCRDVCNAILQQVCNSRVDILYGLGQTTQHARWVLLPGGSWQGEGSYIAATRERARSSDAH